MSDYQSHLLDHLLNFVTTEEEISLHKHTQYMQTIGLNHTLILRLKILINHTLKENIGQVDNIMGMGIQDAW